MKSERVLAEVIPDKRRIKKDLTYPLSLKITFKGQRRYYNTMYSLTLEDWELLNSCNCTAALKKIRYKISALEIKAAEVINTINDFSFPKFEKAFFNCSSRFDTLKSAFGRAILSLNEESRIGYADLFTTTINSIEDFKGGLSLIEVDVKFLQDYENHMLQKGSSLTTIGIYLRNVRKVLNISISGNVLKKEDYPFGKGKYEIPTGSNNKRALNIEQIGEIFKYKCEHGYYQQRSKDFWLLTYLCNGMNLMDIANLKVKNLDSEKIIFIRKKTEHNRRSNPISIVIARNKDIDQIIMTWKNSTIDPSDYLFDIVAKGDSPIEVKAKVKQFTKVTNNWMKQMGEKLKIETKLTTYVARHSFASILLHVAQAPVTFIRDKLGHASLSTTDKYLSSLPIEEDILYTKALTSFRNS